MRVFLIGFMGCGKTGLGREVARKMGCPFVDLDRAIAERTGQSISVLFAERGESYFREQERLLLNELLEREDVVVATGGGTPCFFDNLDRMNSRGITLYLKRSAGALARRLAWVGTETRPLLASVPSEELPEFVARKLADREVYYERATWTLDCDGLSDRAIRSQLLDQLILESQRN